MKKIAVPSEGDQFAQHFGRCPEYTIYEVDGEKIVNKKVIENPGHKPGFLPKFLKEKGVDCVIASGMGGRAKNLFDKNGIEVVVGVTGSIDKVVKEYLQGEISGGDNICSH